MAYPESPDDTTDWSALKRYAAILALIVIALGGYAFWRHQGKPAAAEVAATPAPGRPNEKPAKKAAPRKDRASVRSTIKLAIPERSVTADMNRQHLIGWLEKAWLAGGLTDPVPPHLPKEKWASFVKAAIQSEVRGPEAPAAAALRDQALDLAPVAAEHPVSAYVVGQALLGHETAPQLLEKAADGLRDKPGMETLAFHAAAAFALTSGEGNDEKVVQERLGKAAKALRKALDAAGGFAKEHDLVCAFVLYDHVRPFFEGVHGLCWTEVEKTEGVEPWAKKWLEGLHCVQNAWDARGGGYSNTVSDDGQAVFKHESEKARRLLEQAWELKPATAAPAVALIYSGLSLGERGGAEAHMRRWFNEAIKVQMDEPEAAQHLLWGLRPRWYGSHKKMEDVGLACLETGRFDSALPWVLLQAHRDSASEWDVPDEYYKALHCYDRLNALFDGAEAEAKRAPWRSLDRTHAAIASLKCAEYEEAQRWLEKLEFKPDRRAVEAWGIDPELLIGKTAAFAGEAGKALRTAEEAECQFQAAKAAGIYREVLKSDSAKLSPAARAYLEKRTAIMDIEDRLKKGETVSLMPDEKFLAWSREGGGWRLKEEVLEHLGREAAHVTTNEARVGDTFTVEGEIEVTDPGEGAQVWIAHGYPERTDKDRWIAVRFAFNTKEAVALLSNGMGAPLEHPAIQVQPRFKFAIQSSPAGITLTVDGKPVFENVPAPEDYVKERYSQIGFGAATQSEKTRIRIHALSVKL